MKLFSNEKQVQAALAEAARKQASPVNAEQFLAQLVKDKSQEAESQPTKQPENSAV